MSDLWETNFKFMMRFKWILMFVRSYDKQGSSILVCLKFIISLVYNFLQDLDFYMSVHIAYLNMLQIHTYHIYFYTGWGKSRFTVVCMETNTSINNNTRINCVSHTHSYKRTFNPPCVYGYHLTLRTSCL